MVCFACHSKSPAEFAPAGAKEFSRFRPQYVRGQKNSQTAGVQFQRKAANGCIQTAAGLLSKNPQGLWQKEKSIAGQCPAIPRYYVKIIQRG